MSEYAALDATIAALGLEYTADFVPLSKSRNAGGKYPTINWRLHLSKQGVTVSTDYSQGSAYLPPSVLENGKLSANSMLGHERIKEACETGRAGFGTIGRKAFAPPALRDVLYSLVSDASAIEDTFEDWASNYGYDTDSRKAEATYKLCVELGLTLRRMIGDAAIAQLRELFQDY